MSNLTIVCSFPYGFNRKYQNYKLDKVCKIIIHPTFLMKYISSVNNIVITPNIN